MATLSTRFKWASPDRYKLLRDFAKENRKHATVAEAFLWKHLRKGQLGVEFRRQYVVSDFIVDFVCIDKGIVVEVDGAYHAEPKQQEDDALRTARLGELGFRVMRFTNEEVLYDIEKVLDRIGDEVRK